jgi:hypothetical protein
MPPNKFPFPQGTENPAGVEGLQTMTLAGSLSRKGVLPMKFFYKRKPRGFKLTVVIGKMRFALDYPSS